MKKIIFLFSFLSIVSLDASTPSPQEKLDKLKKYFFKSDAELSIVSKETINPHYSTPQLKQINKNYCLLMESMLLDSIELKRLMKLTRKKNIRLEREIKHFELEYAFFKKCSPKWQI